MPLLRGRDVKAWEIAPKEKYAVIYPYNQQTGEVISEKQLQKDFPNTYAYLQKSRHLLKGRGYFERSNKIWYELWCPRDPKRFIDSKLVVPEISDRNNFAFDVDGCAFNTKVYGLVKRAETVESYHYLLGILNSRLLDFLYKLTAPKKAGGFFAYKTQFLEYLPIRRINFSDVTEIKCHDEMVAKVDAMLELKKLLSKLQTDKDKSYYENKCSTLDHQIDQLVYDLYGLTEDEINIVEGS